MGVICARPCIKYFLFRFYNGLNIIDRILLPKRNFQSVKLPYVYFSYSPLELLVMESSVHLHLCGSERGRSQRLSMNLCHCCWFLLMTGVT